MKYLIVAAHPDDEALGAGATIHKAAMNGDEVYVCLLSHWSPTRDDNLEDGIASSHAILGVKKSYVGDFGCMRFKDEDHHAIVRFIEAAIKDCQPDVLITHHPADLHVDHGITSECCMEASRLPMRQTESTLAIRRIMFMEVPSSTDWNISIANGVFVPNMFVSVDADDVYSKIKAIGVYKDVIRKVPHPRSETAINALATLRGSQSGAIMAESFQLVFGLGV